ncbi:unannotated protein [freshwater metagenome]|uniref:Unannotated protein n=1 Tax=freshwater metagenome TaxID=449393 RepID=A0A6J7CKH6_9ZZZZ|nr:HD domain-containing protein [Actinomycetota bacterium]
MSSGPLHLLLLEDSATDAELLGARLRSSGLQTQIARVVSREEFAAALERHWDAIIADFRLPGFDALEALDLVTARGIDTPVIVVTGAVGEEVAVECMKRGASDYLLKDRLARLPQALEQVLEQRRLRMAEAEARNELRIAHEETIRRLAIALDSRSSETGLHVTRMSNLAARLGVWLGMDAEQLAFLPLAAAMHDIGKIGIRDAILEKPGPLTPDERLAMQAHTTIGHEILSGSGSELLELAAQIALTHHERWDGSGYPNHLVRQEIPFPGRIAAVADVFDALTSDRVYRKAFSESEAVQMMRDGRGSHFDPVILDALLELVAEDTGSPPSS